MIRAKWPMQKYYKPLAEEAETYGVWLLDRESCIIEGVGFAGNFGSYDTSLWQTPTKHTDKFPMDRVSMERNVREGFQKETATDMDSFFHACQMRLKMQLDFLVSVKTQKIVVATHTVPTGAMLRYDETPAYDFQNAWMGWDDEKTSQPISQTPNLVYQFCGHVHRSYQFDRPGSQLINVSGPNQPLLFEI